MARRHGLSPQQLFGWRRQLRDAAVGPSDAEDLEFVPAVVDVGVPAPALGEEAKAPRRKSRPAIGMIEIEVDGVTIRIGRGADANMVAAVVLALKAPR